MTVSGEKAKERFAFVQKEIDGEALLEGWTFIMNRGSGLARQSSYVWS